MNNIYKHTKIVGTQDKNIHAHHMNIVFASDEHTNGVNVTKTLIILPKYYKGNGQHKVAILILD